MSTPKTYIDLFNLFNLDSKLFFNLTELTDCKSSFSIQCDYQKLHYFQPFVPTNAYPQRERCIIRIVYLDEFKSNDIVPLKIRIDIYIPEPWQHRREYTMLRDNNIFKPISITSRGDFFVNSTDYSLQDKHGNKVSGNFIINRLINVHTKPSRPLQGIPIRLKLLTQYRLATTLYRICDFIQFVVSLCFGKSIQLTDSLENIFHPSNYEMIDMNNSTLTIMGITASKRTIVTFSILILSLYTFVFCTDFKLTYLSKLLSTPILTACLLIATIAFLESLAPRLLFQLFLLIHRLSKRITSLNLSI